MIGGVLPISIKVFKGYIPEKMYAGKVALFVFISSLESG